MISRSRRLIDALGLLVNEESFLVNAGDIGPLPSVQDRIGDVLRAIVGLPLSNEERERVLPLIQLRESTRLELVRMARSVGGELDRVRGARGRLRDLAPAYRTGAAPSSKFVCAA